MTDILWNSNPLENFCVGTNVVMSTIEVMISGHEEPANLNKGAIHFYEEEEGEATVYLGQLPWTFIFLEDTND